MTMMEKAGTSKPSSKKAIFKLLPKVAASAVAFHQSLPFSPTREKRLQPPSGPDNRAFSGPMVSIVPVEARRNPKNGGAAFCEPKSPKVSCMGQVKKCKNNQNHERAPDRNHQRARRERVPPSPRPEMKKQFSVLRKMFSTSSSGSRSSKTAPSERRSSASIDDAAVTERARPSLSEMKRFASGRDTFANFDWTAQVAPVDSDPRDSYSDDDEDFKVPFSAPILGGGGGRVVTAEPKKEVNLWKRRTMEPPRPLVLS